MFLFGRAPRVVCILRVPPGWWCFRQETSRLRARSVPRFACLVKVDRLFTGNNRRRRVRCRRARWLPVRAAGMRVRLRAPVRVRRCCIPTTLMQALSIAFATDHELRQCIRAVADRVAHQGGSVVVVPFETRGGQFAAQSAIVGTLHAGVGPRCFRGREATLARCHRGSRALRLGCCAATTPAPTTARAAAPELPAAMCRAVSRRRATANAGTPSNRVAGSVSASCDAFEYLRKLMFSWESQLCAVSGCRRANRHCATCAGRFSSAA